MPRRKRPQCMWQEGQRRCTRNATDRTPFCRAHEIAAAQAAAQAAAGGLRSMFGGRFAGMADAASGLISDIIAGNGIDSERIASTITDAAWTIGGNFTRFHPDVVEVGEPEVGHAPPPPRGRRAPRPGGWHREPPPPPPVDEELEVARKVARAREVLGFGPQDTITPDLLRARHRELAKRHHPDRGGNVARMQEINAAVDTIASTMVTTPPRSPR